MPKPEANYEELEHRVDSFIVLESFGFFSMAMAIDYIHGIARHYNISKREAIDTWQERIEVVDAKASTVKIDVVMRKES